jgi:hypothetical protein
LIRKPEGKIPLERSRHRWEVNIRMDLRVNRVESCGLVASGSELGPVVGPCEHGNEPLGFHKRWGIC